MAERLGFEPRPLSSSPVFKTGPLAVRTSLRSLTRSMIPHSLYFVNTFILFFLYFLFSATFMKNSSVQISVKILKKSDTDSHKSYIFFTLKNLQIHLLYNYIFFCKNGIQPLFYPLFQTSLQALFSLLL